MDQRLLVEGCIANFGISLDVFEFLSFGLFFPCFNFFVGFCVFLVHPTVVSVLLSASVERFDVYRMRDFFYYCLNYTILHLNAKFMNIFDNSFRVVSTNDTNLL